MLFISAIKLWKICLFSKFPSKKMSIIAKKFKLHFIRWCNVNLQLFLMEELQPRSYLEVYYTQTQGKRYFVHTIEILSQLIHFFFFNFIWIPVFYFHIDDSIFGSILNIGIQTIFTKHFPYKNKRRAKTIVC